MTDLGDHEADLGDHEADLGDHEADLGDHEADPGNHDGPIWVITMLPERGGSIGPGLYPYQAVRTGPVQASTVPTDLGSSRPSAASCIIFPL